MNSLYCPGCQLLVTLPHDCPNYTGTPLPQQRITSVETNLPTPLERIATALEQLVEIFKQAEDTQNRRLPRDAE